MLESKVRQKLTQKRLKEVLHYDPETGIFARKFGGGGSSVGDVAGSTRKDGYVRIIIEYVPYYAHRLAWLYISGYFPENDVDHIDRNPSNNRINNLREITHSCNLINTGNRINNTSGVKGVYFDKSRSKWLVTIMINRSVKHVGRFDDFVEAVCVRFAVEQCLNWNRCGISSPAHDYVTENIIKRK